MNIKELYEVIGGDYDGVLSRFMSEERIKKFVGMFPGDPSYKNLIDALEAGDIKEAFRAAHTIKGVSLNLGFTELYKADAELTEALRGADDAAAESEAVKELAEAVTRVYVKIVSAIGDLAD